MKKLLLPDYILKNYRELTAHFLLEKGKKALILDIDNTLVTYDDDVPTEALYNWLSQLSENGIKIAFVSNNTKERVDLFNSKLSYVAFSKSAKPFVGCLKKAMALLGVSSTETALMGDQILTDMLAGNRMGLLTVLVPPIKDKRDAFTRFKRLLERPVLKKYYRNEKEKLQ